MIQQPLFCEDIYEALRTIAQAYGGSKKIGSLLWPEMLVDKAAERWANCLNRTRPEKLDPEQVLLILRVGREIGCHAGMAFISGECGYRYEPIEPEDERAKLQRLYIESVHKQEEIVQRLERLNDTPRT